MNEVYCRCGPTLKEKFSFAACIRFSAGVRLNSLASLQKIIGRMRPAEYFTVFADYDVNSGQRTAKSRVERRLKASSSLTSFWTM